MSSKLDAVGAFRVVSHSEGTSYGPRPLPDATIRRFVEIAERDGLLHRCGGMCPHDVILDLYSGGDIVDDRCVVDERAWAAINSELALAVSS